MFSASMRLVYKKYLLNTAHVIKFIILLMLDLSLI